MKKPAIVILRSSWSFMRQMAVTYRAVLTIIAKPGSTSKMEGWPKATLLRICGIGRRTSLTFTLRVSFGINRVVCVCLLSFRGLQYFRLTNMYCTYIYVQYNTYEVDRHLLSFFISLLNKSWIFVFCTSLLKPERKRKWLILINFVIPSHSQTRPWIQPQPHIWAQDSWHTCVIIRFFSIRPGDVAEGC